MCHVSHCGAIGVATEGAGRRSSGDMGSAFRPMPYMTGRQGKPARWLAGPCALLRSRANVAWIKPQLPAMRPPLRRRPSSALA